MGKPLELDFEVADSSVPVCWYKDGVKLLPQLGWDIQSSGTLRRLTIPSAELLHAGLYSCESSDDTIHFNVDIKGDFNLNLLIDTAFRKKKDFVQDVYVFVCLLCSLSCHNYNPGNCECFSLNLWNRVDS